MHQLVNEMLRMRLKQNPRVKEMLPSLEEQVENQTTTAYAAATRIIDEL